MKKSMDDNAYKELLTEITDAIMRYRKKSGDKHMLNLFANLMAWILVNVKGNTGMSDEKMFLLCLVAITDANQTLANDNYDIDDRTDDEVGESAATAALQELLDKIKKSS